MPLLLLLILTICISVPDRVFAGDIRVQADRLSHDQVTDVISAAGNVEIGWSGATLYADMADYYRIQNRVSARGRVRLVKGGDTLSGESAEFDMERDKGVIRKGTIFISNKNLHLTGERIERQGEQDYLIENGTITTCDSDDPGWKFKVDDLKMTVDEFAYGKNALFYLGEVPVFWLPYILFPAKIERQSGFLIPQVGNSSKRGVFLELPYYLAISPSQDLTITTDLQSKRGVGFGLEHRYLGVDKGRGENRGYLIYDTGQQRFRGDLEVKQQMNFTGDTYWRADVSLVLDRDFFRDYGTMSGEYNRQYLGSSAFLSHRYEDLLFTGGVDYLNNLDAPDNNATLQKLPYLTANGTGRKLSIAPVYYSFAAAVTNFDRDTGDRGQRLQVVPRLQLPFQGGDLFSGSIWGGYNQRFYRADAAGEADGSSQRGLVQGGGTIRTELARTFDSPLNEFDRVRHLVVPELSYAVTENGGQGDLPFFDYDDRIVGGQLLTFSLHNTVTGRTTKGDQPRYRDLLRFSATQGYQLSGERRDLLVMVDYNRAFTDTGLLLELLPGERWRLFTDNRISPYNGNVTNSVLGASAGDPKGTRASLEYHHADKRLDYIEGTVAFAGFQPYLFSTSGRYSFDRPGYLETLYSIEYKHQCWGVVLAYRDRIDNKEFSFMFNLSGLGNFKLM